MSDLDKHITTTNDDVGSMLTAIKNRVGQILPGRIGPDRVLQTMAHSIRINPKLMNCTRDSLLAALLQSAREGLEIGTECHLVPRSNKGVLQCVYQRDFRGELTLARRSGEYAAINADIAFENDDVELIQGTENKLVIKPNLRDRGEPFLFWCSYSLKEGGDSFTYITLEEATQHMNRFAPKNRQGAVVGPWVDHFEAMSLKTVIKKALKYGPKALDFQASQADERVLTLDTGFGDLPAPLPEVEQPEQIEDVSRNDARKIGKEPEPEKTPKTTPGENGAEKKKRRGRPPGAKNKPKTTPPPEDIKDTDGKEEAGLSDDEILFNDYMQTIDAFEARDDVRNWIRDNGPAALMPALSEEQARSLHKFAFEKIAKLQKEK